MTSFKVIACLLGSTLLTSNVEAFDVDNLAQERLRLAVTDFVLAQELLELAVSPGPAGIIRSGLALSSGPAVSTGPAVPSEPQVPAGFRTWTICQGKGNYVPYKWIGPNKGTVKEMTGACKFNAAKVDAGIKSICCQCRPAYGTDDLLDMGSCKLKFGSEGADTKKDDEYTYMVRGNQDVTYAGSEFPEAGSYVKRLPGMTCHTEEFKKGCTDGYKCQTRAPARIFNTESDLIELPFRSNGRCVAADTCDALLCDSLALGATLLSAISMLTLL